MRNQQKRREFKRPDRRRRNDKLKPATKKCNRCDTTKRSEKFYNNKRTKDGLQAHCMSCDRTLKRANWLKPGNVVTRLMQSAKRRGVTFAISRETALKLVDSECYYCGDKPCGGIDRVDNNKAYKQKNVVPCCWLCNSMKHTLTLQEFWDHLSKIAERHLI